MPLPDPSLVPAERDPKKLRNTALALVAIMIVGGWLVLKAYERWSIGNAGDDRPAIIYRITPERDLRMVRQDGEMVDLKDLRGKVVAIHVFSLRDPQAADRAMAVMQRLARDRAAEADFNLVSLLIDPIPPEELITTLAQTALDREIKLPRWWLGSNEPKTLHKFIKNELKADTYPNERSGTWDYDASIVLIDKDGHIRRAVVPQKQGGPPFIATFDFNQAASWDAKGVKTGTELDNAAQLEALLNSTIDKLLAEPAKEP
jgi:cytochrome oxidase Cu insertion factor (SCO1/SenC/PrrC family)